ncbi:hypothetical protein Afil01_41670 [Actinorhabdospora filicis]|uniref:YbaB/EbfC DNA-binding family protein n=1 Tax=Actinorhabdospora filicis TaxID=1785913 RepID=A0A9W6SLX7_9ACTN|nr:YbaB/EbfC family nucleoid-associated protein [Actinorhabdospora filicis]GLZ79360.1 hypothetical protein Afil01_41670 [Actinorhabdospora filicis]
MTDYWEDDLLTAARADAAALEDLAERVTALRATATDAAGLATVTVDAGGVPTDLVLGRNATRRTPGELAAVILATMRAAQAKLAAQVEAAARGVPGLDDATRAEILGEFRARYPEERR